VDESLKKKIILFNNYSISWVKNQQENLSETCKHTYFCSLASKI